MLNNICQWRKSISWEAVIGCLLDKAMSFQVVNIYRYNCLYYSGHLFVHKRCPSQSWTHIVIIVCLTTGTCLSTEVRTVEVNPDYRVKPTICIAGTTFDYKYLESMLKCHTQLAVFSDTYSNARLKIFRLTNNTLGCLMFVCKVEQKQNISIAH